MSAEERSAWAAEVAAQARSLLEPPTIEHDAELPDATAPGSFAGSPHIDAARTNS